MVSPNAGRRIPSFRPPRLHLAGVLILLLLWTGPAFLECARAAPPSRSKLSVHLLSSYTPGARAVIDAHPPVLKILDTGLMQAVRDYKAGTPAGLTVLRIYTPRTWTRATPAADAATDFWNTVLAPPLAALSAADRALIDYVEGPNEGDSTPTWGSAADTVWYNDFWLKLAQLIADAGFKPCAYSIAVGNPPGTTAEIQASLDRIAPSLSYIKSRGGAWGYHNYTVQYTTDPAVENYYSLRHRMYYSYFQTAHPGLVDLPVIMTEGGVDGPGAWTERGTAQDFQNWLNWLDGELRTEPRVLGVTLFQIGETGGWNRFNVEPVAGWIASHVSAFPGAGTATLAMSPPVLTVTTPAGTVPAATSFTIRNSGPGTINYTLADDAAWLHKSVSSGSSAGEEDTVTLTFDSSVAGMPAGTYNAVITATSPEAGNSPRTLPLTLSLSGPAVSQPFDSLPPWNTTSDASWGSAAVFDIVSDGQTGTALEAQRSSPGSSVRVQYFALSQNTSFTISVWVRCPAAAPAWWAECGYKLGAQTAADFDDNPGSWTMVKKFSDSSANGNGNVWTQYASAFNSGSNPVVSVGFKHGASGGNGPVVQWDQLVITPSAPVTLTKSIASSADDAEESAAGTVNLTSTDIEMVNDAGTASGDQTAGLRFTGLNVPPGAVVTSATLQFKADETQSTATALNIAAVAATNAGAWTTAQRNLSSRPVTTGVLWQPAAWNVAGEAGAAQRTPNLAAAVQEVVGRPGWASGNALALIITGSGQRTAEAFDKSGGVPATLSLTFTTTHASSFAQWMQGYPSLTGSNAAATANPDGDAFSNLLEYALRLHPAQANIVPYTVTYSGSSLVLQYTRPSVAPDLVFTVESSTSPASGWTSAGIRQQVQSDDGNTRTLRATVPAVGPRTFVRIKVTLMP